MIKTPLFADLRKGLTQMGIDTYEIRGTSQETVIYIPKDLVPPPDERIPLLLLLRSVSARVNVVSKLATEMDYN